MTDRIPPHGLDPTGGAPGQVPTINPSGTALEYADPAGGLPVIRETLTAAAGDVTLTIGATPIDGTPHIWVNGVILWPGVDYTITGETVSLSSSLTAGDAVWLSYQTTEPTPAASTLSHPVVSYADQVLADSPLLYLKLDETSGTTVVDSSGNGRNFTNSGATLGASSLIASGTSAYDFNGASSQLTLANAAWMNTSAFTIEAWINLDSVTGYRVIASKDATAPAGWAFYVKDGKLGGFIYDATTFATTTLATGTTYHVAMTFSGGTVKFYINGTLDGTFTGKTLSNNGNTFVIGASHGANDNDALRYFFLDGRLDDLAYYGTALSDARLAAHHAAA